jgi:hypothetical protein
LSEIEKMFRQQVVGKAKKRVAAVAEQMIERAMQNLAKKAVRHEAHGEQPGEGRGTQEPTGGPADTIVGAHPLICRTGRELRQPGFFVIGVRLPTVSVCAAD